MRRTDYYVAKQTANQIRSQKQQLTMYSRAITQQSAANRQFVLPCPLEPTAHFAMTSRPSDGLWLLDEDKVNRKTGEQWRENRRKNCQEVDKLLCLLFRLVSI